MTGMSATPGILEPRSPASASPQLARSESLSSPMNGPVRLTDASGILVASAR